MQELFRNEDFANYRALEIERGVDVLNRVMEGHESPDYFKGAVEMLKKILVLPLDEAKGEENIKYCSQLVEKAFNIFDRKMMRRLLSGEETEKKKE